MKLFKTTFALIAAASCFLAAAAHAQQTTTISFSGYSNGTPIPFNMFTSKGVTFTAVDAVGNVGAPGTVFVPETSNQGVSNSPTGAYPTTEFLNISFTRPALLKMFIFNNEGSRANTYSAFNKAGQLLATGSVSTLEGSTPLVLNLAGVSLLQFDNTRTSPGGSWIFELDSITFSELLLFKQYALTRNQYAVASALDYAVAANNPGIQNLVNYLGNLPTNYLPASFDMISGEEYTSVFDTAYAIAHLQNQAITNHLASIQAGEPGLSLGLVSLAMASGGKSATDGKDSKIVTQPVVDNRWGFFATANGDFTDITGDTNADGFQYATEGLTLGVDYRVLPQLVLGAYLAYEHSYTTLINNGALDQNGITGGLYGSWFSQGFYVDGIVGGGYNGFTGRRQSVGGFTRGDGDNTLLNAAINGGYDMHYGAWTFGPQLGIEYDDVWLNSFTENGSLAPLSVASQSENSLRSTAGGHISYTTHVGGVTVRPDVHAAWQHEYDSPANSLGAQIAGTNAAFVVQGPYLGRNSALAGAGVTVELSEKTSVYADYEGQFGRTNEAQSTVSVGFQTKF